jgi:hypothetical protein
MRGLSGIIIVPVRVPPQAGAARHAGRAPMDGGRLEVARRDVARPAGDSTIGARRRKTASSPRVTLRLRRVLGAAGLGTAGLGIVGLALAALAATPSAAQEAQWPSFVLEIPANRRSPVYVGREPQLLLVCLVGGTRVTLDISSERTSRIVLERDDCVFVSEREVFATAAQADGAAAISVQAGPE